MPLLVMAPVKRAGEFLTSMVRLAELEMSALMVDWPPVKVMVPSLVRLNRLSVPKPEIWPVLVRDWLLLSMVPPVRVMRPGLEMRPEVKRSLLPDEAVITPELLTE